MNKKLMFFILSLFYLFTHCTGNKKDTGKRNLGLGLLFLNASASSLKFKIPDTNQTKCYSASSGSETACVRTGYDADYINNAPSYTKSSDGKIITDNVTGLMWTQSTDTDGNGILNYSDKKLQSAASSYCDSLSLGGYDDWRLPDIKTLYSLIQFSGKDASSEASCSSAGNTSCAVSDLTPFIDSNYFDKAFGDTSSSERVIDAQYASSTNYVSATMNGDATAFGVNFADGRIKGYPSNTKAFYIRCVRGNTSYGVNSFTDNGNQTVTDSSAGLMWQKEDFSSTDHDNAVSSCESAVTAGYSDWRLPNVKELQSILDYTRSPDKTSSAAIDSKFTAASFTNEKGVTDYAYYWASTTHAENDGNGRLGTYVSFGRALGYMNGTTMMDVHGAGAQRSNYKINVSSTSGASSANIGYGTFYYKGPQGDVLRQNNRFRCVRSIY